MEAVEVQRPVAHGPPIVMFTAPNPGPKTLTGTHTYVVGRDPAYIIDPGPADPEYQSALARYIRGRSIGDRGMPAAAILLSHGHPDHAPGASVLKELLSVPVYASGAVSPQVARHAGVDYSYAEGASFDLENDTLAVIPAPGHAPDQVAFWMPGCRVLVTGDTMLGEGSTLVAPPEGDMTAYMDTLRRFLALDPALILPGHGPLVGNPPAKIDEYIQHRLTRERQLVESLRLRPATIPELVSRLYAATDPRLHILAEGSVAAQLEKLAREGSVSREGDVYRLCDP